MLRRSFVGGALTSLMAPLLVAKEGMGSSGAAGSCPSSRPVGLSWEPPTTLEAARDWCEQVYRETGDLARIKEDLIREFEQASKALPSVGACPPPSLNPPNLVDRMIDVDHALLGWGWHQDHIKAPGIPMLTLEHCFERDGDGPGMLVVDQRIPCHTARLRTSENGDIVVDCDGPVEYHFIRMFEINLADPYQVLIADLIVRSLAKNLYVDGRFIRSWNQRVIDAQNFEYRKAREEDRAPVEFVKEPDLRREFHAIHRPVKERGTKEDGPSRVWCRFVPIDYAERLTAHHNAVDSIEANRRRVPT